MLEANRGHWTVSVRNLNPDMHGKPDPQSWIVEITRSFEPGDLDAYRSADLDALGVMRLVPTSYPGSTWGTTSDGVGGHAGLTGGYYRLVKSGVSASFAKALAKGLGR
jgi:hypothetical protein